MTLTRDKRLKFREMAGLSRDPLRLAPAWPFGERDGHDWTNLRRAHESGQRLAREMAEVKRRLEGDGGYTPDGISRRQREHFQQQILPKIENLRSRILSDLKTKARGAVAAAERDALSLPSDGFQVAVAMRTIDRIHDGINAKGAAKLRLSDLQALPVETRRLLAAVPAFLSGLSDTDHAAIKRSVFEEIGSAELVEARELLQAVEAVEESLDYSQTVAELEAGYSAAGPEIEKAKADIAAAGAAA